jgi:hypothetical protein
MPLTLLFTALAGLLVLVGFLLTGLTFLALLATLALLLAGLLAGALLILGLLLTFLARLIVLIHWTSKNGLSQPFDSTHAQGASFRRNPMVPKVSSFHFGQLLKAAPCLISRPQHCARRIDPRGTRF